MRDGAGRRQGVDRARWRAPRCAGLCRRGGSTRTRQGGRWCCAWGGRLAVRTRYGQGVRSGGRVCGCVVCRRTGLAWQRVDRLSRDRRRSWCTGLSRDRRSWRGRLTGQRMGRLSWRGRRSWHGRGSGCGRRAGLTVRRQGGSRGCARRRRLALGAWHRQGMRAWRCVSGRRIWWCTRLPRQRMCRLSRGQCGARGSGCARRAAGNASRHPGICSRRDRRRQRRANGGRRGGSGGCCARTRSRTNRCPSNGGDWLRGALTARRLNGHVVGRVVDDHRVVHVVVDDVVGWRRRNISWRPHICWDRLVDRDRQHEQADGWRGRRQREPERRRWCEEDHRRWRRRRERKYRIIKGEHRSLKVDDLRGRRRRHVISEHLECRGRVERS